MSIQIPTPPPPASLPTVQQLPPNIKVAICIPALQSVDIRWAFTLQKIYQQVPPNSQIFTDFRYGLAETRETLFTTAVKSVPDLTHILWVDSDILPDDQIVPQLILDNKPIVSGLYFNSLFTGVAAWKNDQPINIRDPAIQQQQLIECDKIGMGICVFQKAVWDELKDEPKPLFYYKIDSDSAQMLSEDFYFFQHKCMHHGIKPWVDLRCRALHLKNVAINPEGLINSNVPPPPPQAPPQPQH